MSDNISYFERILLVSKQLGKERKKVEAASDDLPSQRVIEVTFTGTLQVSLPLKRVRELPSGLQSSWSPGDAHKGI